MSLTGSAVSSPWRRAPAHRDRIARAAPQPHGLGDPQVLALHQDRTPGATPTDSARWLDGLTARERYVEDVYASG